MTLLDTRPTPAPVQALAGPVTIRTVVRQVRRLAEWAYETDDPRCDSAAARLLAAAGCHPVQGFDRCWSALIEAHADMAALEAGTYQAPRDVDPDTVDRLVLEAYEYALDVVCGWAR